MVGKSSTAELVSQSERESPGLIGVSVARVKAGYGVVFHLLRLMCGTNRLSISSRFIPNLQDRAGSIERILKTGFLSVDIPESLVENESQLQLWPRSSGQTQLMNLLPRFSQPPSVARQPAMLGIRRHPCWSVRFPTTVRVLEVLACIATKN